MGDRSLQLSPRLIYAFRENDLTLIGHLTNTTLGYAADSLAVHDPE